VTSDGPWEGAADIGTLAEVFDGGANGNWVLDINRTRAEFPVRNFWGAVTVRGRFGRIQGEGTMAEDGWVNGVLTIEGRLADHQEPSAGRSPTLGRVLRHRQSPIDLRPGDWSGSGSCRGTSYHRRFRGRWTLPASAADNAGARNQPQRDYPGGNHGREPDRLWHDMEPLGMASRSATLNVITRFVRA
jgi:hypothetical protein